MSNLSIIGFDGIDGSGKTTLIKKLLSDEDLKERVIFTTRNHPPSPYVEEMYHIIHQFKESFDPLDLFVKDLHYRYSQLPTDKIILSDRTFKSAKVFYDSILELLGIQDKGLYERIKALSQEYVPILNVLLLADVENTRQRILKNRGKLREVEETPFQTLCAKYFSKMNSSDNVLVVDTNNLTQERVYDTVRERILGLDLDLLQGLR